MIEYKKTESKRKTVSIEITADGTVLVRCPLGYPEARLQQLVLENQDKIEAARAKMAEKSQNQKPYPTSISTLYYLGVSYPVESVEGFRFGIKDGVFFAPRGREKEAIMAFLKNEAHTDLNARVHAWSSVIGKMPTQIKITSAVKRWGSAGTNEHICFPWRLMLLPPALIDYVVVHELCHLWEHNHSSAFYLRVGKAMPDYKSREKEIRVWEKKLREEGWYHVF